MYKEKVIGIFELENTVNGKVYIGFSNDLKKRFYDLCYLLKNGKMKNKELVKDFHKYGDENFSWSELERCSVEMGKERLRYWIDKKESINPEKGYNSSQGFTRDIIRKDKI